MAELILPGISITVRDEGLITAGRVVTGNIGIVGTAEKGPINSVQLIGSFTEAQEFFGEADDSINTNALTLVRALEHVFNNGGRTIYAVRTAADNPLATRYTFTTDDIAAPTLVFQAKTAGTWGNDIKISITNAGQNVTVQEVHKGKPAKLNRVEIDDASKVNTLILKQKASGLNRNYEIIYTGVLDPLKPQVLINPLTGDLTFTALETHVPIAEDEVVARYETKSLNNRKIEFSYKNNKEVYLVADASHLAEQVVNRRGGFFDCVNKEVAVKNNFKKTIISVGLTNGTNGAAATAANYRESLSKLESDVINIVLLAGQDATNNAMMAVIAGHINSTTENKHERIAIVGCNGTTDVNEVANHNFDSDRIIYVGPGVSNSDTEKLSGSYTAAAIAGLLSSLPVQSSPTNKVLTLPSLATEYSNSKLEKLVQSRVLAVEKRNGFRVVKGITTATNSAWHQITTRRIVDYAIYGVRSSCNPYIGKLNNDRVRGAMKATLDAFLTRMVDDEALVSYDLAVTANRAQEIAGEAIVTMTVRPTFSIDFIRVTMYLG